MEDIKKRKGNVLGVVFTDVFSFASEFSAAVFGCMLGYGSSVCQRLTLHRERAGRRERGRQTVREKGGWEGGREG